MLAWVDANVGHAGVWMGIDGDRSFPIVADDVLEGLLRLQGLAMLVVAEEPYPRTLPVLVVADAHVVSPCSYGRVIGLLHLDVLAAAGHDRRGWKRGVVHLEGVVLVVEDVTVLVVVRLGLLGRARRHSLGKRFRRSRSFFLAISLGGTHRDPRCWRVVHVIVHQRKVQVHHARRRGAFLVLAGSFGLRRSSLLHRRFDLAERDVFILRILVIPIRSHIALRFDALRYPHRRDHPLRVHVQALAELVR
mmetsp:Transcript_79/g.381  ORF Transcript_79/g.381 Transcript_79/m.381 type:complete len:248 (-) Transcript_79:505-1248(-)